MALPNSIDPTSAADLDNPSLGASQFRNLKQFIVDVYGVPVAPTLITAPAFAMTAGGILTLSQGQMIVPGIAAPSLSPANNGKVYFDSTANRFKLSQNAGPYVDMIQNGYGSRGQRSLNNAVTPNTKFDLAADMWIMRNPTDFSIITRSNPATVTNDITVASAVNGRDQAGAFTDGSWVHFYVTDNGTTTASLSSTVAPPTGPTLQGGHTHWTYAGPARLNAVQTLAKTRMNGNIAYYEAVNTVLTNGNATVETAVSISTAIPPNALSAIFTAELVNTHSLASVQATARIRIVTGVNYVNLQVNSQVAAIPIRNSGYFDTPNVGQQIFYLWSPAFDTVNALTLNVAGYCVPNGAV